MAWAVQGRMRDLAQRQLQTRPATLRPSTARLVLPRAMTTSLVPSTFATPRHSSASTPRCRMRRLARGLLAQRIPSAEGGSATTAPSRLAWPAINAMWPARATQSLESVRIPQPRMAGDATTVRAARLQISATRVHAWVRLCSVPRVHIAMRMPGLVSEMTAPLASPVPC